jgi:hypothetical protein
MMIRLEFGSCIFLHPKTTFGKNRNFGEYNLNGDLINIYSEKIIYNYTKQLFQSILFLFGV